MLHRLEVDKINKSIKGKILLCDAGISCETGEIVGLMGRSGVGKSTLLRIILGAEPAEKKSIRIDGVSHPAPFKSRNILGYLPPVRFIPNNLTIGKILNLYLPNKNMREKVISHPEVKSQLHLRPGFCHGATARLFEILLLLHMDFKFLLLDNPFGGMDPTMIDEVTQYLKDHKTEKGIIITDYFARTVMSLSDRLVLIDNFTCWQVK
ncbi:ATP-binding cassette domain-containing protein [Chitinophaga sp. sic0106]|uniref:ATP-binding cassette domain-containing protein n=1 Tax=Chitinophaga sp. sic0106 TaxID=2854785 RepID=UPI001C477274|nr:ATP-binding cassette domain-containing protein [Chitinophaga sp. sic0106]MBV7531581.1 ATP-binding cassette domain-containing protein [Chitinophaga sp. sic0106]